MITAPRRRTASALPAGLLAGLLTVAALAGCKATLDATPATATSSVKAHPAPSGSALKALDDVKVKGRSPKTGYSRDQFGPAWADTDHNGCDQRNDILRRDLTGETLKAGTKGCVVLAGTLKDKYTGEVIEFRKSSAAKVQIDHVVALQNAWVTGASGWSAAKRKELATDPLNLLAAQGAANESKGSGDAATWLPPRKAFRCDYVARQVAVKLKYGAWMTSGEHRAIEKILTTCPDEKLPTAGPVPLGESGSGGKSGSGDKAGSEPAARSDGDASAGAYCSTEGAKGTSDAGTKLVCSAKGDDRPRWRSP
jgi:Protein of unknown function (DUF1524)